MTRGRLEAFSDGVMAIIITIMVLELRPPHGADWHALGPVVPRFLYYLMSFVYLAIYWNNHHHMFHTVRRVSGGVLWANMVLLFCLSLVPFATDWIGETHAAPVPTAVYGVVMLMAALAYYTLQTTIIRLEGCDSLLRDAVGGDWKGKVSPVAYVASIPLAFVNPWISIALFAAVALIWIVPDPRMERVMRKRAEEA